MLEWVISSAALTALIIVLRFVLKGKISLRLQYALWGIVLLRLLVPVSFGSTGLSVMNAVESSEPYSNVIASLDTSALPYGTLRDTELSLEDAEAEHGGTVYKIQGYSTESGKSELHTYFFKAPARKVIGSILTAVWVIGIAAVALWFISVNTVLFIKLRKSRTPMKTTFSPLPVYVTGAVETPCLFGFVHPAIYLTPNSCADETRMRQIITHELMHFRHFDHVWSLLRCVCLALHWFDPLVWWAAVLSRRDSELACDEATIKRLGEAERAEYGRTLIEMTCRRRPALLHTATTMTGGRSSIRERINMIAKKPKTAILTLVAVILIIAVAAGCTFTGAKKQEYSDEWFVTDPAASPSDFVDELFASGDAALTLYLADGAQNTCPASEWYAGRFKVLMSGYEWTSLPMPPPEPSPFWLTAVSADGTKRMTFWANGGAGVVQYEDGSEPRFWSAKAADGSGGSIANDVRFEYDNLEADHSRISFSLDGSAEDAADHFVHSAYGSHMTSLAPGSAYGMSDYEVVEWSVREVSERGDAVVGMFRCAFTPWDFDSPAIWAGNTDYGTGKYQGKLTYCREFVLQKQEDGLWHCIGLGTGGYMLP